ncbi:MAG: hypothetical protein J2P58_14765 [Acidimicrobiaceae bacterium]|nr:hypothetical protein [Acidimicrobiaceae bacterium]
MRKPTRTLATTQMAAARGPHGDLDATATTVPLLSKPMIELPGTLQVPVVRTDYSSDAAWQWICEQIASPTDEGFKANVEFVEDRSLEGLVERAIVEAIPRGYPSHYPHAVLFVVDAIAISPPDHALLVVDLHEANPSEHFRAIPRAVQSIENNLSIANMDFVEFASAVDPAGIFRGF